MKKAYISVGFTKSDLTHYRTTTFTNLTGADVRLEDGLGNIIKANVREGGFGYLITLNGKDIATGSSDPHK